MALTADLPALPVPAFEAVRDVAHVVDTHAPPILIQRLPLRL